MPNIDHHVTPGMDEYVLANNSARFTTLLNSTPEAIDGYADYSAHPVLVFDAIEFRIVHAGDDYDAVDDYLADTYGEDYAIRYHIIETGGD